MAWEPSGNFISGRAVFLRETAGEQGAEALGSRGVGWGAGSGVEDSIWSCLLTRTCLQILPLAPARNNNKGPASGSWLLPSPYKLISNHPLLFPGTTWWGSGVWDGQESEHLPQAFGERHNASIPGPMVPPGDAGCEMGTSKLVSLGSLISQRAR